MSVDMKVLIEQMIIFFVIMCCGFIGTKIGIITKGILQCISQLMMKLVCPMMVLCIYPAAARSSGSGAMAAVIMPLCAVAYLGLAVLGFGLAALAGLHGDKKKIFIAQCQFGNLGFFGLPLVKEIFEPMGILAFSLCILVDSLFLWTEGVVLTSGSEGKVKLSFKDVARKMANPVTFGLITGLILMAFHVSPDHLVLRAFDSIGSCAKPLSLIFIGGTIANMELKSLKQSWPNFLVVALKMFAMPLLVFYSLTALHINAVAVQSLTLVLAMPSMASLPIMADNFGSSETDYAAQGVFIITLCSLVTIPLVAMLTH